MANELALIGEENPHETPQMKRCRLASEMRFITQQLNSKIAELLEAGLEVHVHTTEHVLVNRLALIGNVEVSYQTPRKYY